MLTKSTGRWEDVVTSKTLSNEVVCRERPYALRKDSQALLRQFTDFRIYTLS